jgi:hypothetical protein
VVIVDGQVAPGWVEVGVEAVVGVEAQEEDSEEVLVVLEVEVLGVVAQEESGRHK